MNLVDSHCHLDDAKFDADREQVLERAQAAGVRTMLAIGTGDGPPDLEAGIRLAEKSPAIYATAGVHPHNAAKTDDSTMPRLRELLRHPRVVGLGEIGLDYHYDVSPRDRQQAVFREQLAIAGEARTPIIIHTREAWEDTMLELRTRWAPTGLPCVLHCFTGNAAQVREALELDFFVSFAGIVTYPKALDVQEAARLVPLDRLLIETDAPYLAPVPHRGKRNEPAFVAETARKLAELRGEPLEVLASESAANFRRIFGIIEN
jgi:TatD DNase family protein